MLYFTLEKPGQSIAAIYNGRTAFVPGTREAEARKFLHGELPQSELLRTLHHELCHQSLFSDTYSGTILSGYRVLTRLRWQVQRCTLRVAAYYRARAIFYLRMRALHEELVHHIEESSCSDVQSSNSAYIEKLKSADSDVVNSWRQAGIQYSYPIQLLLHQLGKQLTQHFCIVCGHVEDGVWKEFWVSKGGIVNDRETRRPNEGIGTSLLKALTAPLQIERWFNQTLDMDWQWLQIKFREEYRCTVASGIWTQEQFDSYLFGILRFAAQWSEFRSRKAFLEIAKLIRESVRSGSNVEIAPHWIEQPTFHKFVNFFYLHGN